jgi:RNA-directed DNA polymerase
VYLNELDQFVKHEIKATYYLRYVDDFVILDRSRARLEAHRIAIRDFLRTIQLDLHPTKCRIIPLRQGVAFLGFRIFYHHKLVRQRNTRTMRHRINAYLDAYEHNGLDHEVILNTLQGWEAYAMQGNTFRQRQRLREHVLAELATRTRRRQAADDRPQCRYPMTQLRSASTRKRRQ